MPQLTVRNVPALVVAALKTQAAAHGRSAEAEHRDILAARLPVWRKRLRSPRRHKCDDASVQPWTAPRRFGKNATELDGVNAQD